MATRASVQEKSTWAPTLRFMALCRCLFSLTFDPLPLWRGAGLAPWNARVDAGHEESAISCLLRGDGEALRFNTIERRGCLVGRLFPVGAHRFAPAHARFFSSQTRSVLSLQQMAKRVPIRPAKLPLASKAANTGNLHRANGSNLEGCTRPQPQPRFAGPGRNCAPSVSRPAPGTKLTSSLMPSGSSNSTE